MKKVGITGGIGSGKTIITNLFSLLGIAVFNADYEAKRILETNNNVRSKLISLCGSGVYLQNRSVDRKKLASLIFNDKYLLEQVNEIVHPEVRKEFNNWSEKQTSPFVVYEAAILFESGHYSDLNYKILVLADEETRMKRVMLRDSVSRELVKQRMANQWKDEKKIELSDFIIRNNAHELIIPQVLKIFKLIKADG